MLGDPGWVGCSINYDNVEMIKKELGENSSKVLEYYANVAGDPYNDKATEIAVVAEVV